MTTQYWVRAGVMPSSDAEEAELFLVRRRGSGVAVDVGVVVEAEGAGLAEGVLDEAVAGVAAIAGSAADTGVADAGVAADVEATIGVDAAADGAADGVADGGENPAPLPFVRATLAAEAPLETTLLEFASRCCKLLLVLLTLAVAEAVRG